MPPTIHWVEDGQGRSAQWRSERDAAPPARVVIADDRMSADTACRLASEGTALLWRGDFHNARHLLQAMARRIDRPGPRQRRRKPADEPPAPGAAFHLYRQAQAQRARTLAAVLVEFDGNYGLPLRRAPDVRAACEAAWGPPNGVPSVVSLRELLGLVGAHEWRRKGVEVPALGPPPGNRIHPHYGVFSPVRGEYLDLVAAAPWPEAHANEPSVFDIGTGSGVIAAVLARRRSEARIVATDLDPRALACARENLARLGLGARVSVAQADLFPAGRAALVVCNPPWLPARPGAPIERAIYDEGSRMLLGFLDGLAAHLLPGGHGWLILSDLAEHLGLRTRAELLAAIERAGLRVLDRIDARPRHAKAVDPGDPLHAARAAEVTSLWRLEAVPAAG